MTDWRSLSAPLIALIASWSGAAASDWGTVSGSLALTSDYRFRGVSQSDLGLAPQAELDWNVPDNWTVTAWASRIDFRDHENTSVELDLSAIKHFDLDGTGLDLEAIYHAYPDHHPVHGGIRYSAFEAIATASHTWDAFSMTGTVAWSPDNVGETGTSWYLAGGASYAITPWLSASTNVGIQWMHRFDIVPDAGYPYTAWDTGLTARHGDWSLDLRYEDTDLDGPQCLLSFGGTHWCQAGVVATMSYAIFP
jgi:uncharacterized protein (TIGR02001 family)